MRYAVIACSQCRRPWLIELRHRSATCPACQRKVDVARRTRLWQGDDIGAAQAAVAAHRADMIGQGAAVAELEAPMPRYDDPVDAAAAKARGTTNKSERAELVLLWLTRMAEQASHEDAVRAMERAGLTNERAEKEVVRMLATDVIFEPLAGHYRHLEP